MDCACMRLLLLTGWLSVIHCFCRFFAEQRRGNEKGKKSHVYGEDKKEKKK